jgi:predicted peptidase
MTSILKASILLVAFPILVSTTDVPAAEMIGEFEVHEHRFTGGEYEDEAFKYLVLPPTKVEPGKKYPLLVFLHGAGERGTDPNKLLFHFPVQMSKPEWRNKYPCYLLVPQCRPDRLWMKHPWTDKESKPLDEKPNEQMQSAIEIVERSIKELPIDQGRVYLTGLSMGGFGSWEMAMRRPNLFAAVAPVCGGGDESRAAELKHIPIWAAHGDADGVVWVGRSRGMVEAVKAAGGSVKYTEYPGVGHNSWTPFHTTPNGVVDWMFQQKRTASSSK